MFERFTERARQVIVQGQNEAARLRHDYIGTEHLLLGLLREGEGVAAQALNTVGVTLDAAQEQVESIVGRGEATGSQAPFTPRSKKVFELALRESLQLGHDYIGTEHLLLGLLHEPEGVSAGVLSNLGADPEAIRQEVMKWIGGPRRPRRAPGPLETTREVLRRSFRRHPSQRGESPFGAKPDFGKFTGQARRIVVLAQDEARHFNHNYIGTEHLLLGLLRDRDSVGAGALGALGVDLDEVRGQIESIVGYGEEGIPSQAPLTPRTQKVLQMAEMEALQLDDHRVRGEHILLGLVREGEGVGARVLSNLGVDPDAVRREVIGRLPGGDAETEPMDQIERVEERDEHARMLFRGRVKVSGIETTIGGRAQTLVVELDYVYDAGDTADPGSVMDHDGLISRVSRVFEGQEIETIEDGISKVGAVLPIRFPALDEITVSATRRSDPGDGADSALTVVRTFRR